MIIKRSNTIARGYKAVTGSGLIRKSNMITRGTDEDIIRAIKVIDDNLHPGAGRIKAGREAGKYLKGKKHGLTALSAPAETVVGHMEAAGAVKPARYQGSIQPGMRVIDPQKAEELKRKARTMKALSTVTNIGRD